MAWTLLERYQRAGSQLFVWTDGQRRIGQILTRAGAQAPRILRLNQRPVSLWPEDAWELQGWERTDGGLMRRGDFLAFATAAWAEYAIVTNAAPLGWLCDDADARQQFRLSSRFPQARLEIAASGLRNDDWPHDSLVIVTPV